VFSANGVNGEEAELIPLPPRYSGGDTLVHFVNADAIVTGEIFQSVSYPTMDCGNREKIYPKGACRRPAADETVEVIRDRGLASMPAAANNMAFPATRARWLTVCCWSELSSTLAGVQA